MLRRLREQRPRAPGAQIGKRRVETSPAPHVLRIRRHRDFPVLCVNHQRLHRHQLRHILRPAAKAKRQRQSG